VWNSFPFKEGKENHTNSRKRAAGLLETDSRFLLPSGYSGSIHSVLLKRSGKLIVRVHNAFPRENYRK
jgi:hypothetical protein